jgi:IS4 transposase
VEEYDKLLRVVRYYHAEEDKIYTYITNNFELPASTIAKIYKYRWKIEEFFRWIKQNLKIKSFL